MEYPIKLINNIEEVRNTVFKKPSYKEITKMYNLYNKEYIEYITNKNQKKECNSSLLSPSF